MWLTLFTAIISVWRKYYITVCHWASLPVWDQWHHTGSLKFDMVEVFTSLLQIRVPPTILSESSCDVFTSITLCRSMGKPTYSLYSEENHRVLHFVMSLKSQWSISVGASVPLYNLTMIFWSVFCAMLHTFFFTFSASLQHVTLPLLPPSSQSEWKSPSPVWVFVTPWTSPGQNTGVGSLSLPLKRLCKFLLHRENRSHPRNAGLTSWLQILKLTVCAPCLFLLK